MPAPPDGRADLAGMPRVELESWVAGRGWPGYRAGQIYSWIHRRLSESFQDMTDLPSPMRRTLEEQAAALAMPLLGSATAADGTVKYLLGLPSGGAIESVLIPDPPRLTACLSTQLGCPAGCIFCMTGRSGFGRNLAAGEITGQMNAIRRLAGTRPTNVVMMGMGEPLLNPVALARALEVLTDPSAGGVGSRHVTVSTIGIPDAIADLALLPGQIGLALSLHSAVESTRREMIPASSAWPLREVHRALADYSRAKNRPVTLEYCLIAGLNDSTDQARALCAFTDGLRCKVNLLGYNRVEGLPWKAPPVQAIERFRSGVAALRPSLEITVRRSRGGEVAGACGQLGGGLPGGRGSTPACLDVSGQEGDRGSDREP
jgi:23S rRNA (adenine2503-C2)-methyltransferase